MGIFTRFRDIVNSNINAILDQAEDPEKLVRMMIVEMEETLIEVKAGCAGVMADRKKVERSMDSAKAAAEDWEAKATLAVQKGRDDLARAALAEKNRNAQRARELESERDTLKNTVAQFQEDIAALESKLTDARTRQRSIIQRRSAAVSRMKTQSHIRQVDTSEVFARFEAYENGIERLEAEAELVDGLRPKSPTLAEEFSKLEHEEEIEKELSRIKDSVKAGV